MVHFPAIIMGDNSQPRGKAELTFPHHWSVKQLGQTQDVHTNELRHIINSRSGEWDTGKWGSTGRRLDTGEKAVVSTSADC